MSYAMQISQRRDRQGSQCCNVLADFIYIMSKGYIPLLYNSNCESIYLNALFKLISESIKKDYKEIDKSKLEKIKRLPRHIGIRQNNMNAVIEVKQDLNSFFKKKYESKYFKYLEPLLLESDFDFNLPWNDNTKIICIHLRIDDVHNKKDYDGNGSADYINSLIHENYPHLYKRNVMLNEGLDNQAPIQPEKLKQLLYQIIKKYPKHEIHVVYKSYENVVPNKYNSIFSELKKVFKKVIKLHSNNSDYDTWLLINSDILVMSKSYFSIFASYLHKGTKIYAPIWGSGVANGIKSIYNKSKNFEFYS
tara:strand:- start:3330 stop:4247 length:918 start_codon:yes stop_codon:yes gene_type:complete